MRYASKRNFSVLLKIIRRPRFTFCAIRNAFSLSDHIYSSQSCWTSGKLPRVPITTIFPDSSAYDLQLIRALDRKWMSITIEELSCVLAIAKGVNAKNILEIGTWDGNTALNLAVNTHPARVVTMDLPIDFTVDQQKSTLAYPVGRLNLTDRKQVGRQLSSHSLGSTVRQVYGDSAVLDWGMLGSPFDLIFIDGCHEYSYVKSDSRNALSHVRDGGAVVWHDYGMNEDVSRVVDEVVETNDGLKAYAVEGTRLAVAFYVHF